jgi:hypothetical protein
VNSVRDLILITDKHFLTLCRNEVSNINHVAPFFFILSILFAYWGVEDVEKIIKRLALSAILIFFINNFYEPLVYQSLDIASQKIELNSSGNILTGGFVEATQKASMLMSVDRMDTSTSLFDNIKGTIINSTVNYPLVIILNLLCAFSLIGLKWAYSVVFYLNIALSWIVCSLYLLPNMEKMITGFVSSILWTFLVPYLFALLAILVDGSMEHAFSNGQMMGDSIEGTILILSFSLSMFMIPAIAFFLLNGTGIATAGVATAAWSAMKLGDSALSFATSSTGMMGNVAGVPGMSQLSSALNTISKGGNVFDILKDMNWGKDRPSPQKNYSSSYNGSDSSYVSSKGNNNLGYENSPHQGFNSDGQGTSHKSHSINSVQQDHQKNESTSTTRSSGKNVEQINPSQDLKEPLRGSYRSNSGGSNEQNHSGLINRNAPPTTELSHDSVNMPDDYSKKRIMRMENIKDDQKKTTTNNRNNYDDPKDPNFF